MSVGTTKVHAENLKRISDDFNGSLQSKYICAALNWMNELQKRLRTAEQERDQLRQQIEASHKQEPVGYVVIGQGISFYKTTLEEAQYQANSLEWRDDKAPEIHLVYRMPYIGEHEEIWFRSVNLPQYPEGTYCVMSYKGAGDIGPFYASPVVPSEQEAITKAIDILRENLRNPEKGVVYGGIYDNDKTREAIAALIEPAKSEDKS